MNNNVNTLLMKRLYNLGGTICGLLGWKQCPLLDHRRKNGRAERADWKKENKSGCGYSFLSLMKYLNSVTFYKTSNFDQVSFDWKMQNKCPDTFEALKVPLRRVSLKMSCFWTCYRMTFQIFCGSLTRFLLIGVWRHWHQDCVGSSFLVSMWDSCRCQQRKFFKKKWHLTPYFE